MKQIQQSIPRPPKIVPPSVRYRRYKQLANRRNIATSPISTINLTENEEEESIEQPEHQKNPMPPSDQKEPIKPSEPVKKKIKRKKTYFLNRKPTKPHEEKVPKPPQTIPQKQRKYHSPSKSHNHISNKPFQMPSPQVVLDIEAVKNQYDEGKFELLPLVQRIDNDTKRISMNKLKFNENNDNIFNTPSSQLNSIDISNKETAVKPLIEQNKKQIFLPFSSILDENKIGANQSSRRPKQQQPLRSSRRSSTHYENAANDADITDSRKRKNK